MKKLALLLLASSPAYADVTFAFESKDAQHKDKPIAAMKKEADNHKAALDAAAGDRKITLHATLLKVDVTPDKVSCKVQVMVGLPNNSLGAILNSGASVEGKGDGAIDDCASAVLGGLLDRSVDAVKKK